jgi:hypothetical protein
LAATRHTAADRFVESSFTPELRLIVEKWLDGSLDHLDAVIFSRGDDSGQRVYYYLCELQRRGLCRGPRALLFDVATLARTASIEHTLDSVQLSRPPWARRLANSDRPHNAWRVGPHC